MEIQYRKDGIKKHAFVMLLIMERVFKKKLFTISQLRQQVVFLECHINDIKKRNERLVIRRNERRQG